MNNPIDILENPNLNSTYFSYVITDTKYNIKYYSNTFNHFLLKKDNDLINKKLTLFYPNISPNDMNTLYEVQSIYGNKHFVIQSKLNLFNNELCMWFFYDYSISEELEKQIDYLNRQQYMHYEMLNKLEDGIYITDQKGTTLYVNDAFLNLSGLKREQLIGETVYALRRNGVLPNSCCARVIETMKPVSTINNYYEGQRCLVSGSPITDEEGNMKRTIAIIRDVSELDILMKSIAKEESIPYKYNDKLAIDRNIKVNDKTIISKNDKMKSIYFKAKKIANVDSTVLILGETGVGKDFLASYIHSMSNRSIKGNLIKVNCGAIPEHLIESELFGYEEGAFTGAIKGGKKGLFEEANNGTIFLDEIGDMPYTLQVKLLNAINDRIYYRIGGIKPVKFDARIIAATNANLKKLVNEKKFRLDLYYRLNVVNFVIPPLRNRKEDILTLAQDFLEYYNNKHDRNCFYSTECLESFLIYTWPGNIREIKNLIERLVLISDKACLESKLFREQIISGDGDENFDNNLNNMLASNGKSLKIRVQEYEKIIIEETLLTSSTLKEAANKLGIDISTLIRKKQKYCI